MGNYLSKRMSTWSALLQEEQMERRLVFGAFDDTANFDFFYALLNSLISKKK